MRIKSRAIRIVAAAVAVLCVIAVPAHSIVYGQLDGQRHPNVGTMVLDFDDDGDLDPFCSGTLIAPKVFLTAAHCTFDLEETFSIGPGEVQVTFDSRVQPGMRLYSGTAFTHPQLSCPICGVRNGAGGMSDPHDIAVIVFDQTVPLTPAVLPPQGLLNDLESDGALRKTRFTTVGYGWVRETRTGGGLGSLDQDNVDRRVATQAPLSLTRAMFTLSLNQATGNGGSCFGDSGGPHFLGAGTGETNMVVSLTVDGDQWCKATDLTYRLDSVAARDFLDEFVPVP